MWKIEDTDSKSVRGRHCKKCGAQANFMVTYPRMPLCNMHFAEFIESRVKRTIEMFHMIKKGDRIAVALSGGKDSVTLLHILANLLGETNELEALTLDLGISGNRYSEISADIALENCRQVGVKLNVINLSKSYGLTIDDVVSTGRKLGRPPCSACGIAKRYVLNKEALQRGFNTIMTGHNLTDEVTVLLSNLISGDLSLLSRTHPFLSTNEMMVARGKPLSETPEREIAVYASVGSLKYVSVECPHAYGASTSTLKSVVLKMEEARPGAMISLYRSFLAKIRGALKANEIQPRKTVPCRECGMATSGDVCSFCRLREKIANIRQAGK